MYRTSTCSAILSIRPASYVVSVRAVGASPRTSSPTGCYLPAAVLQVWVSASLRYFVDSHHSSHIASVVQRHEPQGFLLAARDLFPAAIYSCGACRPTTIDVLMFHFRVRDGTGWDHQAKTTGVLMRSLLFLCSCSFRSAFPGVSCWGSSVGFALLGRLTSAQRFVFPVIGLSSSIQSAYHRG